MLSSPTEKSHLHCLNAESHFLNSLITGSQTFLKLLIEEASNAGDTMSFAELSEVRASAQLASKTLFYSARPDLVEALDRGKGPNQDSSLLAPLAGAAMEAMQYYLPQGTKLAKSEAPPRRPLLQKSNGNCCVLTELFMNGNAKQVLPGKSAATSKPFMQESEAFARHLIDCFFHGSWLCECSIHWLESVLELVNRNRETALQVHAALSAAKTDLNLVRSASLAGEMKHKQSSNDEPQTRNLLA